MYVRFSLGATNTGLVLADLTITVRSDAGVALSQVSASLAEVTGIPGRYVLSLPNVTTSAHVRVVKTAAASVWWEGYVSGDDSVSATSVIAGLCTLADVKTQLNLTGSDKDQLVTDIIAAAEKMIQNKTMYTLIATNHTEYFSPGHRGGGVSPTLSVLRVKEHPIISVTSIYDDDGRAWDDPDDLIPATDYWFDNYGIHLFYDGDTINFNAGHRTVRAIYRAGYETIPSDLRRACVMMTAHLFYKADRQRQNIASESFGDATVTYLDQAMPKEVIELLKPYTRPCGL